MKSFVERRLTHEGETAHASLRSALKMLGLRVKAELAALERGERLDENIVVNAAHITGDIARWNLVRDLLPAVKEES